ncbi:MAG: YbaK/EbsC family protein [Burkholderiales bacterium]|jgi:prolyl-tRNA editing enzyme YbaK/EbsC (Cys-tRNA(Pro) deacylase)
MKSATHPASLRIQGLLDQAGVPALVVEFDKPTRTSADAALAIGCSVSEIAKSIVFRIKSSGKALLVVASGDNRVSEQKVEQIIGEPIGIADAAFVRESTGFAIGGVAPLGHQHPVEVLLDGDLQRFKKLWAAGGTPYSVFPVSPAELQRITGQGWSDIRQT